MHSTTSLTLVSFWSLPSRTTLLNTHSSVCGGAKRRHTHGRGALNHPSNTTVQIFINHGRASWLKSTCFYSCTPRPLPTPSRHHLPLKALLFTKERMEEFAMQAIHTRTLSHTLCLTFFLWLFFFSCPSHPDFSEGPLPYAWDPRTWETLDESKHSCLVLLSHGAYSTADMCFHMVLCVYAREKTESQRGKLVCALLVVSCVCVCVCVWVRERESRRERARDQNECSCWGFTERGLKCWLYLVLSDQPRGSVSGTMNPLNSLPELSWL